jgi:hypothetical protein
MMDKTLAIRIDPVLHKRIKVRLAENGLTLKGYVVGLIANDLKSNSTLVFDDVSCDIISEESIIEAQKVLDFARKVIGGDCCESKHS